MQFLGGQPETVCGKGSTLRTTKHLRKALPSLLRDLGIKKLIDAPCGDCNWISQTQLSVQYHGIDNDKSNLEIARSRVWPNSLKRNFQLGDIATCELPDGDAILCRDFFQHLENAKVAHILNRISGSKIKWMLATTFDNEQNEELGPGNFRRLNLEIAPFEFLGTKAMMKIPDPPNSGRSIGVWRLN